MKQEDKDLLLKDLCARLPHGVKIKTPYNDATLVGMVNRKGYRRDLDYIDIVTDKQTYPIRYIKPYLRPMSNMTEEERNEYFDIKMQETERVALAEVYRPEAISIIMDWLNAHHFDYRGLIEKGLALEAPNNMYKI